MKNVIKRMCVSINIVQRMERKLNFFRWMRQTQDDRLIKQVVLVITDGNNKTGIPKRR